MMENYVVYINPPKATELGEVSNSQLNATWSVRRRDITYSPQRQPAMTNTRFAAFHGVSVGPCPLTTKPVPLRKSRARHWLVFGRAAVAECFRQGTAVRRFAPAPFR